MVSSRGYENIYDLIFSAKTDNNSRIVEIVEYVCDKMYAR